MLTRAIPLTIAFALAVFVLAATLVAQSPRSVWDGVYSQEQADRGQPVYKERCALCHGDTLEGGEWAPALTGQFFNATWDGIALSDLFDRIRITMPQDAPGSMSRQQVGDVLAHMLSVGKFPAGSTPLSVEAAELSRIAFVSNRPAQLEK
jgi:mono/diheme cytochrome c family protein